MNLGQYVGSSIRWRGREARVIRFTDSKDEMYFTCRYTDTNELFYLNAHDADTMQAIRGEEVTETPEEKPANAAAFTLELRREANGDLWLTAYGRRFLVTSYLAEPRTDLIENGEGAPISIHRGFPVESIVSIMTAGGSVSTVTGHHYGAAGVLALLAEAVRAGRASYDIVEVELLLLTGDASPAPVKDDGKPEIQLQL